MALFTREQRELLLQNGADRSEDKDYPPVVKLFTPDAQATWLIAKIDPEEPDTAFGLCDLGQGFPELGTVSIAELESVRGRLGLPIECDLHFTGKYPLSVYAGAARQYRRITESTVSLEQAAWKEGKTAVQPVEVALELAITAMNHVPGFNTGIPCPETGRSLGSYQLLPRLERALEQARESPQTVAMETDRDEGM